MTDQAHKTKPEAIVGFDSLLEDIFGLNIKGLKSIWALFVRPVDYFRKAKLPEWDNAYTPSFRIWFGITAITTGLRFLWGGENSPMFQTYLEQITLVKEQLAVSTNRAGETIDVSGFDPITVTNILMKWIFVLMPFFFMGLVALFAVVFRSWGEKLSYTVRLRYLFAIVITGNFLTLLSLPVLLVTPKAYMPIYSGIGMLIMLIFYISTAYRGPYKINGAGSRLGMSIIVGTVMLVLNFSSGMIAMVVAMVPAMASAL
jgi:hypothetical protein